MERGQVTEPMFGKPERIYADSPVSDSAPTPPAPAGKKTQKPLPVLPEQSDFRLRSGVSTALEIVGIGSVAVGGFLVAPWLGFIVLGILLIVLGVATGYGT